VDLRNRCGSRSPGWLEAIFLLLCTTILAWQLLLPGFIGMANNGDFPKVAGPLCLLGADHETEKFIYFQPDYLRGPSSCYDPHTAYFPPDEKAAFESMLGNKPLSFGLTLTVLGGDDGCAATAAWG